MLKVITDTIGIDEIKSKEFILDVESEFNKTRIPYNGIIKRIVKDIDCGEVINDDGIIYDYIDRFGYKLPISDISTGAKALITTVINKDKVINFKEAGLNCRDWAILNLKEGYIYIRYPKVTVCSIEDREIDLTIDDTRYHFRSTERLNTYLRNKIQFKLKEEEILGVEA